MTKSELIARLAQRYPQLVAKDAEYAVKMILDAMTHSLLEGHRIEIRGFGSFGLNYRPPRVGRNPKSGEKVHVPEKYVPHFKAGKELRERVDQDASHDGICFADPERSSSSTGPFIKDEVMSSATYRPCVRRLSVRYQWVEASRPCLPSSRSSPA